MTAFVPGENVTDLKTIIRSLKSLASGRSNAFGSVTLAAGAASTTVADENCSVDTVPLLVASTANAAAEDAAGTRYIPVATVANGSFVIQHANNSKGDRTYLYALLG